MKRFVAYNALVALAFLLLWMLLVFIEVRVGRFRFLTFIYIGSLALVFVSFFLASRSALSSWSKHPLALSGVSSLVMSPVLIFLGGILATKFKFLVGGHL